MRIGRAQPLGKDVADSGQFDHRSNAARRDNSGSFGSWFQDDLAGAETAENLMRDRSLPQRHPNEALFRALDALANSLGHFVGFAQSVAHQSVRVAGYHKGTETETTAALHDLGDTVDMDNLFLDIEPLRINSLSHGVPFRAPEI